MKNLSTATAATATKIDDRLAYYHRSLTLAFDREAPTGVTRKGGRLDGDYLMIDDQVVKFRVWLIDSLLWTIEELSAGHAIYAFRGYVQACGYAGRLEGMGHSYYAPADAFTVIKNVFEDLVGKGELS